jgi:hypothetical protein
MASTRSIVLPAERRDSWYVFCTAKQYLLLYDLNAYYMMRHGLVYVFTYSSSLVELHRKKTITHLLELLF